MMNDEFAEIDADDFYGVFTNDDAMPGMVYFSMTSREDAVNYGGAPAFSIDQYFSYQEIQTLANELIKVLQRVDRDA